MNYFRCGRCSERRNDRQYCSLRPNRYSSGKWSNGALQADDARIQTIPRKFQNETIEATESQRPRSEDEEAKVAILQIILFGEAIGLKSEPARSHKNVMKRIQRNEVRRAKRKAKDLESLSPAVRGKLIKNNESIMSSITICRSREFICFSSPH